MKFKITHVLLVCSFSVAMSYAAEEEVNGVAEQVQERLNIVMLRAAADDEVDGVAKRVQEGSNKAPKQSSVENDDDVKIDRGLVMALDEAREARDRWLDNHPGDFEGASEEQGRAYDFTLRQY